MRIYVHKQRKNGLTWCDRFYSYFLVAFRWDKVTCSECRKLAGKEEGQ